MAMMQFVCSMRAIVLVVLCASNMNVHYNIPSSLVLSTPVYQEWYGCISIGYCTMRIYLATGRVLVFSAQVEEFCTRQLQSVFFSSTVSSAHIISVFMFPWREVLIGHNEVIIVSLVFKNIVVRCKSTITT